MKRETLRHPKTYDLASRLGCSRPEALGFLTLLWDFTADVSTDGAVGRWPDGSIAGACDWTGDAKQFVDALVAARWIDRDADHRLLIHDWRDHCERWVKAKLERLGAKFAEPSPAKLTVEATVEATVEPTPPRDLPYPNLPEPNQLPPNPQGGSANNGELVMPIEEFVERWNRKAPQWGTRTVQRLSEKRRKYLKTRLSDRDWYDRFLRAVEKMPLPTNKGSDWQPGFDWFVKNADNVDKIIEGEYDWRADDRQDKPEYPLLTDD